MLLEYDLKWDILGWSVGKKHDFPIINYCGISTFLSIEKTEIDMIGIFFHVLLPKGWSNVDVTLQFSVMNQKGNHCCKQDLQHNYTHSEGRGYQKYKKITELAKYVYDNAIHFCVNIKNIKWEHNHVEQINAIYQKLVPEESDIIKKGIQSTINQLEKKNNDYQVQIEKLNNKVRELENTIKEGKPKESKEESKEESSEKSEALTPHQMIEHIDKNIGKMAFDDVEKLHTSVNKLLITVLEKVKEVSSCSICLEKTIDIILVPCGHRTVCNGCSGKIKICPICKAEITQKIKLY